MNDSFLSLIGASIVSSVITIIGTVDNDTSYGIFEMVKTISASGVLAVTFWWITQRLEKRLDEAFNSYKELNQQLLELLKDKNDE